jgi:transcriptional regulator with XRE-family HTH domain
MQLLAICLTTLRTESGFSLREAARQAGITPSYLSKIEGGITFSTISIRTIVNLANTYNTPLAVILERAHIIEDTEYKLPLLPQYLRLKYQMSNQAIKDMEMAKEIVDKKYGSAPLKRQGLSTSL